MATNPINVIRDVLLSKKGNPHTKAMQVANVVLNDIQDNGGSVIPYNKIEMALIFKGKIMLTDEDLFVHLKSRYDFVQGQTAYKHAMEIVHNSAIRKYGNVEVFYYSIFKNNAIYIGVKDNGLLKVTETEAICVPLGTDGIYVKSDNYFSPVENDFEPNITTFDQLIEPFVYDESFMAKEEQTFLIKALFYYSFFDNGYATRLILVIKGDAGSGKTLLEKLIKGLLYGYNGQHLPSTIPKDEHELALFLKNQKYLFIDEMNEDNPNVEQVLRTVATGIEIPVRIKYTANLAYFRPKIWLTVNAIDPKSSRKQDISERLILIALAKRNDKKLREFFGPEKDMWKNLEKCRVRIWDNVVKDLQGILSNLKKNADDEISLDTYYRSKEFADFCWQAFPEQRDVCLRIFNKMHLVQNEHSSEFDPIIDMLEVVIPLLEKNGDGRTKPYKAKTLLELMRSKNRDMDISLPKSAVSLNKKLRRIEPMLIEKFGFGKELDAHDKNMRYTFNAMEGLEEEEVF